MARTTKRLTSGVAATVGVFRVTTGRTSPFGNGPVRRGSCSPSALLPIESVVQTRLRYGYVVPAVDCGNL